MHMQLNIPTGMGKEALILYLAHYRNVGIICAPILKPQYEELAKKLKCEYQINLHLFDRTDYYHETLQEEITEKRLRLDAVLIDDYPAALQREFGSHPKIPMFVHMQDFFYTQKIALITLF